MSRPIYLCVLMCTCVLASKQCIVTVESSEHCNVTMEWRCHVVTQWCSPIVWWNGSAFLHDEINSSSLSQKACCGSLSSALDFITNRSAGCNGRLNVTLYLKSTTEDLQKEKFFNNADFSQISFLGATKITVIQCKTGAALYFNGSSNDMASMEILLQNITLLGCGNGKQTMSAALYFTLHCHITLSDLRVQNSNGSALVLINVLGAVDISHSAFLQNELHTGQDGAGVYMAILLDEREHCNMDKNLHYRFLDCVFSGNMALPPNNVMNDLETKGGGMFIRIAYRTKNVQVHVMNCSFINNAAYWGSGLLVLLEDSVSTNNVVISKTVFKDNHYPHSLHNIPFSNSGGGAVVKVVSESSANNVTFNNCTFRGNAAVWGGGLGLLAAPTVGYERHNNHLIVTQCFFIHNTATNGAAINMYCKSASTTPETCNAIPLLSSTTFVHNGKPTLVSLHNQIVASVVDIGSFPTTLEGELNFYQNFGSPIRVHETSITLREDTVLNFTENTAQNGGAISLYGSWITVYNNTTLIFSRNKAFQKGGAIYAYQTEEAFIPYASSCFIRYYNTSVQPKAWDSTWNFNGNKAGNRADSIYATSLFPCLWRSSKTSTMDTDLRATFCSWSNWYFDCNCNQEIHTSARNFSSTPKSIDMFPGVPKTFIQAVDDLGHNVTNISVIPTVWPMNANKEVQFINNSLTVFDYPNTHVSILLELQGDRSIFLVVNVSLQNCPPGFSFNKFSRSCICVFHSHIYCNYEPGSHWIAHLVTGYCMSYSKLSDQKHIIIQGQCPFTSGLHSNKDIFSPYLPLPPTAEMLEDKFCGKFNRSGKLCGDCMDNYSIDVFSDTFKCYNCSGSINNWLIFLAVEGLPPLVFFMAVILLHISVTSGPANGFIFCSQVLTISLEVIIISSSWKQTQVRHPYILSDTMVNLYSIWSLDFFRIVHLFAKDYHLCLGPHIKVIHVLVLQYLSVVYPLVFLMIAFAVIELHARNWRILVWLWKPLCFLCVRFRQTWKVRTSVVDAFAAFILLSYVKMVRISLLLTTYSPIYDKDNVVVEKAVNYDPTVVYLSYEHAPFAVIGAFFLVSFGLLPPLLLTFYQFRFLQKCLNSCRLNRNGLRIFMDTFQGCYKDGKDGGPDRRFFAGLYFIFRIIVFSIFDMSSRISRTYTLMLVACVIFSMITVVVQPYKKAFYNYLDIFFFNLLVIIMALHIVGFLEVMAALDFPLKLIAVLYSLTLIPLAYMICYMLLWVCTHAHCVPDCAKKRTKHAFQVVSQTSLLKDVHQLFTSVSSSPDENTAEGGMAVTYSEVTANDIPDRLANSYRYRSLTLRSVTQMED